MGVSYSAKTSYQAQECLGCKDLYALGGLGATASGAYSRFVASKICDAAALGIKAATTTNTSNTTPVTVAATTPVAPTEAALVDYSDKDADLWVGLAVVLVAIVAVVALACGHHGDHGGRRAQDSATGAEGEKADEGPGASRNEGTTAEAQAASSTPGGSG